ncbi:MAG: hypothetical protein ABIX46_03875 [Burkholderiaceae bacterium]
MTSRSLFFRLLAGMLMLLGVAASASAQRADDDYRILQAHYGTPRNHVDVTDQLKQLAERDRSFRMGNDSFGVDPAPGQIKTLRIYARGRDRHTRTFEYVEGSIVDGARFAGWDRGDWGRGGWNGGWGSTPYYTAAVDNQRQRGQARGRDEGEYQILQALYGSARNNVDVTDRLRELAREDRDFRMGNQSFGVDPAPGQPKRLRIYARSADGQTRTFEYREGSIVDGSQFRGWKGGNWDRGRHDGRWGGTPYYSAPVAERPGRDRSSDQGEVQILQARYGTARNNVDVTERLRELARRDRSFRMGNDSFGVDPAPGQVKQLRIYARAGNGQTRTYEYTEGSIVDGAQFGGWDDAGWGRRGGYDGRWGGTPYYSAPVAERDQPRSGDRGSGRADGGEFQILQARYGTARNNVDVTDRLRELARSDRNFRIANNTFGVDPAPGQVKQLRIYTRTAAGATRTFEYAEGGTVEGAQFGGWSNGNWGRGGHDGSWGPVIGGAAAGAIIGGAVGGNARDGRPVVRDAPIAAPTARDPGPVSGGRLNIVRATYGSGNQVADVTAIVRNRLEQGQRLQLMVGNEDLGSDPAPNRPKTLSVTYTVDGGKTQEVRVPESQIITLP